MLPDAPNARPPWAKRERDEGVLACIFLTPASRRSRSMMDTGRTALEEVLRRLEEVPQGGACLTSPDRPCEPLAGALRSEEGRGAEGTRAAGRTRGRGEAAQRALMHAWHTSESQLFLSALSDRKKYIQVMILGRTRVCYAGGSKGAFTQCAMCVPRHVD